MERQLRTKLKYRDVLDVEGYVRKVARSVVPADAPHDDFEQMVTDGLTIAALLHQDLEPGASLRDELAGKLGNRLRDRYREWRRDFRRNTRAGTTRLAAPTGMAHEHDGLDLIESAGLDLARAESRLALADATEDNLCDPNWIGRRVAGVPSYRPMPTVAARELMTEIEAERDEHVTALTDDDLRPLSDHLP